MADATSDFTTNLPAKIQADADNYRSIGKVFLFKISGEGGGTWTLDLKDDLGVHEGEQGSPDCTLELDVASWSLISEDFSAAMALFTQGKIKVSGNPMDAMKLQHLLG